MGDVEQKAVKMHLLALGRDRGSAQPCVWARWIADEHC